MSFFGVYAPQYRRYSARRFASAKAFAEAQGSTMYEYTHFYIEGKWVHPEIERTIEVINPSTERCVGLISLGSNADVNKAVYAAKMAFASYSQTSVDQRVAWLEAIIAGYQRRINDIAEAICAEMGAPITLANSAHAPSGLAHFMQALATLKQYAFEEYRGSTCLRKEPVGVCALITPWNWPINQIACKVAPALAAGCTMVLKPSEIAPFDAAILTEIIDEAGLPHGVFNLVNGDGPGVGRALSAHPDVDMVSFTGSTRAGIEIAKNAANTVKRITQELGGKSANILLHDADFETAVSSGVRSCFVNSGQSCNAPTRMLVPASKLDRVTEIAKAAAQNIEPKDAALAESRLGPVASKAQYDKVQRLIKKAIEEGADLVVGGSGKPEGMQTGYFVKPTIFSNVSSSMTIAQDEVFGPVLAILPYKDEAEAIAIANDTLYGLSGYVSGEPEHARRVAKQIRTGTVHINGASVDYCSPFGGYKQSGNGREWGLEGFEAFLEVKTMLGYREVQVD